MVQNIIASIQRCIARGLLKRLFNDSVIGYSIKLDSDLITSSIDYLYFTKSVI